MDVNDLTPEDQAAADHRAVIQGFNDWINDQIRAERLKLYTVAEIIGIMYLRTRMHLVRQEGLSFIERIISSVETAIESGSLEILFSDGDTFKYVSAEDIVARPELKDMIQQATQETEIEDFEIENWLNEGGSE